MCMSQNKMLRNLSRICQFSSRYLRPCRNELSAVTAPLLRNGCVEGMRKYFCNQFRLSDNRWFQAVHRHAQYAVLESSAIK